MEIPEQILKQLSKNRIIPMCPYHNGPHGLTIKETQFMEWHDSAKTNYSIKIRNLKIKNEKEDILHNLSLTPYAGSSIKFIHIWQNVIDSQGGTRPDRTYECAEYIISTSSTTLYEVYSQFYQRLLQGYKILEGPQGSINKYLIKNDSENLGSGRSWHPISLGKFSHSGVFLTETEALLHCNEIIAKCKSELSNIELRNNLKLIRLEPGKTGFSNHIFY